MAGAWQCPVCGCVVKGDPYDTCDCHPSNRLPVDADDTEYLTEWAFISADWVANPDWVDADTREDVARLMYRMIVPKGYHVVPE